MKRCQDIRKNLPELMEGDLKPEQAEQAREHLQQCPACRRELELMKASWEALDAWQPEGLEVSPTFRAQVWERIRNEPVRSSWLGGLEEWFGLRVVTAASVLFLGFWVGTVVAAPPTSSAPTPLASPSARPIARGQASPLDAELTLTLSAPRFGQVSSPLLDVSDEAWEVELVSSQSR